jgi:hypothetical protein
VLVGSSYGGAIAVELPQRRLARPTLLLAQAALRRGQRRAADRRDDLPVHGTRDAIIDVEDSRARGPGRLTACARSKSDVHARTARSKTGLIAWVRAG